MNASPKHQYAPLFRRYAEGIIYKPSQMTIQEIARPGNVNLLVNVHASDIGILCGKAGATVRAFNVIFSQIGKRHGDRFRISIEKFGNREMMTLHPIAQDWNRSVEAVELVIDTLHDAGFRYQSVDYKDRADTTIITINSDAPQDFIEAIDVVIHAWGKSLGRRIIVAKPDQIATA